ncbi:LOW QUALITY PROTEIN: Hypothetical protein PHPALM_13041, partial [Phytophthora palmivora]
MRPKMSNKPQGPVTALIETSNKLEAVQILMRTMKEAGVKPKHFDANVLFDLELAAIQDATATLHKLLVPLTSSKTLREAPKLTTFRSPEYQTGSSQYASATSEAGSDTSADLQRMTLGPSGSSMLHKHRTNASQNQPGTAYAPLNSDRMHTFFNAAMDRFLKEQQTARTQPMTQPQTDPRGMRDVEMESVGSHSGYQGEFDPDDLSIDVPRPALVASAGVSSGTQPRAGVAAPRIRVSAISELKEFSGKENDEDRARSWLGKVKSAFVRDQALDGEKCLVFGDLLNGPARNWYRQLSRSTRSNWKDLLGTFQTQYCGQGVSVARQYYHARKRSDDTCIVAGLGAKLQIKDGPEATRREHVERYIETLDDRDLADQLAILRLADADALEDTLRARQRAKARQGKAHAGSSRFRQKAAPTPNAAPPKTARAVQAVRTTPDSSESESDSGSSGSEDEFRQMYVAAFAGRDNQENPRSPPRDDGKPRLTRCTHCGSSKHDDLGCWKRLTCQKCNRKGHPSDHCLFVCRACGEIHEAGKCPMEEFYNLILVRPHQTRWDVARRRGEDVKLERSPGWNLVRAERSKICIYAYVEKGTGPLKVSNWENSTYNTREMHGNHTWAIASLRKDEYARESRGYWKYHAPGKWFKQAKAVGKLNNERATLLFDSGAEVSIVDSTFARKEAILGMDFMVPAGIRLDFADGTLCLPDEVRIQLAGRRQLFSAHSSRLELGHDIEIPVADSVEVPIYPRRSDRQKLWITRGERWVPTLIKGLGRRSYLRITNLSDQPLTLFDDTWIGIWLSGDHIPRQAGFVSIGSRRYKEWQSLAFEATTDRPEDAGVDDVTLGPMVERPRYDRPTQILTRQTNHPKVATTQATDPKGKPRVGPSESGIKHEEGREVDEVFTKAPGSPQPDRTKMQPEDQDPLRTEDGKELREADQVCIYEGGDLFAEDVESQMAVLPEVVTTTEEEVTIDDLQVGDPE